ncbi:MAG TPA: FkbM family methyltransferase [Bryobacteraceae bacterium]|nr:FkbM family methyltransferase [Bryobacteraceae bacterium]
MRVWLSRGIAALIGLILVADLGAACLGVGVLCLSYAPTRAAARYILGRHGCCGLRESLSAPQYLERRKAAVDHVQNSVHKIAEDGEFTLWDTPQGRFWVQTRDGFGFVPLLAEQELRVYGPIQKGDIVLDCGANIGDFTRSALSDGAASVVAIEISPGNLECLRRNFRDEMSRGHVVVVSDGVWDQDAKMKLYTSRVLGSGIDSVVSHDDRSNEGPDVSLTTIDKIVERLRLPRVNLIKLDVEGAEFRGLVGARETIRKYRPRIAFDSEDFSMDDVRKIQGQLDSVVPGYQLKVGPCIELRNSIRADIMRFEYQSR